MLWQLSLRAGWCINLYHSDTAHTLPLNSHTTASSLTFIFYHLATDHRVQSILREELKSVKSIYDHEQLVDLPYLNAIMNESLRLHPVLPTAGIRQTAAEGVMVAGTYIPPYTTIVTPRYTMARCKSFLIG
jgi:cytochrome P450